MSNETLDAFNGVLNQVNELTYSSRYFEVGPFNLQQEMITIVNFLVNTTNGDIQYHDLNAQAKSFLDTYSNNSAAPSAEQIYAFQLIIAGVYGYVSTSPDLSESANTTWLSIQNNIQDTEYASVFNSIEWVYGSEDLTADATDDLNVVNDDSSSYCNYDF